MTVFAYDFHWSPADLAALTGEQIEQWAKRHEWLRDQMKG